MLLPLYFLRLYMKPSNPVKNELTNLSEKNDLRQAWMRIVTPYQSKYNAITPIYSWINQRISTDKWPGKRQKTQSVHTVAPAGVSANRFQTAVLNFHVKHRRASARTVRYYSQLNECCNLQSLYSLTARTIDVERAIGLNLCTRQKSNRIKNHLHFNLAVKRAAVKARSLL